MRRSRQARRAGGQETGSILLLLCLALAIAVWNTTRNWLLTGLAFGSPPVLVALVTVTCWYMKRRALLASGMEGIDHMSGPEFEQQLLVHFQALGYRGMLTPERADYGADLVLEKAGTRVVVQAKRYRGVVGIAAVQQIIGAVRYYGASKGMVVTNSVFTENATQLAQVNGIELVDREQLIRMLCQSRGKAGMSQQIPQRPAPESYEPGQQSRSQILPEERCPRCGRILVARSSQYGSFVGCSGFPQCRYTRQARAWEIKTSVEEDEVRG